MGGQSSLAMQSRAVLLLCVLALAAASTSPRLFAVQNWYKSSGPPLDLTWKSWRLVEVDLSSGKATAKISWKGGLLPNRDADTNTRLLGAAYDTSVDATNLLVTETGTTFDVAQNKQGPSQTITFAGVVTDDHQGFFTQVLADSLSRESQVFSIYEELDLAAPEHVVTIDAGTLIGTQHLAHNRRPGGASTAVSVIFLALGPFEGSPQLYKVQRYTAAVERIPWAALGAAAENRTVGQLHAVADDMLMVLGCLEAREQDCMLYAVNSTSKSSTVVLELSGLDPGPALGYCKTYHEVTNTLYLGCSNVWAVNLTSFDHHVIAIDWDNGSEFNGGSYSGGGIAVV